LASSSLGILSTECQWLPRDKANEILSNADIDLTMVFERLIFPMLDELLKPQVFRRDAEGMGETRLRASALLCKIFLHYLVQLSQKQGMSGMTDLWMKILGYLDRFMHSGRRDQMVGFLIDVLLFSGCVNTSYPQ
jgi:brefeldin A-resistance guanine nucleotide exchange factor 1